MMKKSNDKCQKLADEDLEFMDDELGITVTPIEDESSSAVPITEKHMESDTDFVYVIFAIPHRGKPYMIKNKTFRNWFNEQEAFNKINRIQKLKMCHVKKFPIKRLKVIKRITEWRREITTSSKTETKITYEEL